MKYRLVATENNYIGFKEARDAYDTTPRGQKELENFISNPDTSPDDKANYILRLDKGQLERETQIRAYKRTWKQDYVPEEGETRAIAEAEKVAKEMQEGHAKGSIIMEDEGGVVEFEKLPYKNIIGFQRAGLEEDPERDEFFRKLDERIELDTIEQATIADSVMKGERPVFTDEYRKYYTTEPLRSYNVDLKGWTPKNRTHARLMQSTLMSIEDSHRAGLNNAGIADALPDVISDEMGGTAFVTENKPSNLGALEEMDEGWIYAYAEFANDLRDMDIPEVSSDKEYFALERSLVTERNAMLEKRYNANQSSFNDGSISAFDDYLEMHLLEYKQK